MAKNSNRNPMGGSLRKRRNRIIDMKEQILRYNAPGTTIEVDNSVTTFGFRPYIPGSQYGVQSGTGPLLVSYFATAKYLPGTSLRWEPMVGATTSGRVQVAFTDNPEVALAYMGASPIDKSIIIRGCDTYRSFPVWQETDIPFPTATRRKMFDVNKNTADVNDYDRACQQFLMYAVSATTPADTVMSVGSFQFHDVVKVEGMHPVVT